MTTTKPTVTCDTLLNQISAYLDGDLDQAVCTAIEAHVDSCDRCGSLIRDFRATTGLCKKAADAPLPASVRQLAQDRIKALLAKG